MSRPVKRVFLIVMDSCGCGAAPDADRYGDVGSNTLAHVSQALNNFALPYFGKLGLGNITPLAGVPAVAYPLGAFGRMREKSAGKDTTTGHWEMMGLEIKQPFFTYNHGFPDEFILALTKSTGYTFLGNYPASGTAIIEELGVEHMQTGKPILYTSADSVCQIAAHEQIISVDTLYQICEEARKLCDHYGIARVIARPFIGLPGQFTRTYNRRDFSLRPFEPTVLEGLVKQGYPVIGIGKISDIFAGQGITENIHTEGNEDAYKHILATTQRVENGLIFCNLVDFDMLFGHRRDPQGYAQALIKMDEFLPQLHAQLTDEDLVVITADHGNDPTFPGSDHTREEVPLLAFRKHAPAKPDLGIRDGFYDIAQTLCEAFKLPSWSRGKSFLSQC